MRTTSLKNTAWALPATLAALLLPAAAASAQNAPVGLTLNKAKQTLRSAQRVDLTRDFATLPLHKGTANGETVWFVITDTSDARMARRLGLNFAPKLANVSRGCPSCAQTVKSSSPVLGSAPVEFEGAPDFSPARTLIPGPNGLPPQAVRPGSVSRPGYSPYVRVRGSTAVFNAPIVATGDGPFDVTTHTNTHDRTLAIDTQRMTTDHLFIRGFANGQPILYLSFEASDPLTATLERSTFIPTLNRLASRNGGGSTKSARASIFQFVNSRRGLEAPSALGASNGRGRAQGVNHALLDGLPNSDAAISNPAVLEGFRRGADVSNIFDVFPTDRRTRDRHEYSPAWDQINGVYTKRAVASRLNGLKTNANEVRRLASRGLLTTPSGVRLGSSGTVINCPALGFLKSRPAGPRITIRGVRP